MTRKIIAGILALVLLGFATYGLAWPYDLKVSFEAPTYPGIVRQTLKTWSVGLNTPDPEGSLWVNSSSLKAESGEVLNFVQEVSGERGRYRYRWSIDWASDSTARVQVKVTEPGRRLANRIAIPFTRTRIEDSSQEAIGDFYAKLDEHLKNFRVRVEEVEELTSTYTAYVPIACKQIEKASFMMQYYPLLTNLIIENDIETNGIPFVEVTRWDEENDSIYFNFCYPIVRSERLPIGTELRYKRFFGKRALRATYNGNYIFSDRAWYALRKEAELRGLETEPKPVEFFFSNPNFGGDEMEWKADIFLPIKPEG